MLIHHDSLSHVYGLDSSSFLEKNTLGGVCTQSCPTPWTVAHQAPLSMEFSQQEYWSGLPFPTLEDPPDPGIKPASLTSPALAGRFFATGKPIHLSTEFHFQKLVL